MSITVNVRLQQSGGLFSYEHFLCLFSILLQIVRLHQIASQNTDYLYGRSKGELPKMHYITTTSFNGATLSCVYQYNDFENTTYAKMNVNLRDCNMLRCGYCFTVC